jgi:phospholipase C
MIRGDRRRFLQLAGGGAIAGAYPGLIERALAIAPSRRSGGLADVDHIVVHMQENRSFDHYFGMMRGVRGLGDPRPLRLPGGRTVWAQPSKQHPDGHVLPYHGDSKTTQAFYVDGADQSHPANIRIFNRGRYDRWGHTGELEHRMLHYDVDDLPFYYALADAFTVCDAYHCSTMTQTYPNRLHLFTGCNGGGTVGGDPQMTNYGEEETPSADMREDHKLRDGVFHWTTYAERLQAAGISWKVYQEYDNYGDNLLSLFPPFRPCPVDSEYYRRGRSWVSEHKQGPDRTRSDGEQLVAAFRDDIANGRLPQISWIVTAEALSEHPTSEPSTGEHVTAGLINALVDHPEVFARTIFILNYDEAGGFYDHMAPPVPPVGDYRGHSTVSVAGETKDYAESDAKVPGKHPIGLGIRTPTIIVSPWSRGGRVCSQLFDHTSVLRLMEERFGVKEPNISDWRRSVCGDLTSALDFSNSELDAPPLDFALTADFKQRNARSKAAKSFGIPAEQRPGEQHIGQRPHNPLPYRFDVQGTVTPAGTLAVEMRNAGPVGIVFTVHDNLDVEEPWHFTIGAGDSHVAGDWSPGRVADRYDLTLRGPNGYWRRFAGLTGLRATRWDATLVEHPDRRAVELRLNNRGLEPLTFLAAMDAAYPVSSLREQRLAIAPGVIGRVIVPLDASDDWYDLTVTVAGDDVFLRRFAGKVETGRLGKTDPGIGAMRVTA